MGKETFSWRRLWKVQALQGESASVQHNLGRKLAKIRFLVKARANIARLGSIRYGDRWNIRIRSLIKHALIKSFPSIKNNLQTFADSFLPPR